jgi:hypothetical protein
MMKVVEKAMISLVEESVMKCAGWYGFNGEEAMLLLMRKDEVVEKEEKRSEVVLPFVVELVRERGCVGLCYNRGLFTQCPKVKKESGLYCKTCEKEALGSESGKPLLGTVEDRLSSDLMEYRDPKGRAPVAYSRIMSQLGLSRATVEAEAVRLGVTIPEEHFATEKKRGRPKVEKKVKAQAETVEDLLSRMVTESDDEASSQAETVLMSDNEEAEEATSAEKEATSAEKEATSAEKESKLAAQAILKGEKEAKLAAQKAEKEAKLAAQAEEKAEKEAKLAAQKAEKEAKLAAQKAEKEAKAAALAAEKEAKAAALAAEKEAKAAALAAEKEAKAAALAAEKEAKAAALAAEKEAKAAKLAEDKAKPKVSKQVKDGSQAKPKEVARAAAASVAAVEAEPKPKKVTVTRITIEGVEYLKTAENLLYNPQTKEEMGIYDPESKTIKPLPEESDDELDEEDYESDAN